MMSGTERRDRGALIALGLAFLAIVCLAAIAAWFGNPAYHQVGQPNTEQIPAKIVHWGLFTPEDTYAQWAMAFFAIVSTAVSIWAVRLVRDTLVLNRQATAAAARAADTAAQANKDARDHFVLEQRPWLALGRPNISAGDDDGEVQIYCTVDAENIGKTPAFEAELQIKVDVVLFPDENVTEVRMFAERCCAVLSSGNNCKLIFLGRKRPFWDYSSALREESERDRFFSSKSYTASDTAVPVLTGFLRLRERSGSDFRAFRGVAHPAN
jgi:hypothetical protein